MQKRPLLMYGLSIAGGATPNLKRATLLRQSSTTAQFGLSDGGHLRSQSPAHFLVGRRLPWYSFNVRSWDLWGATPTT